MIEELKLLIPLLQSAGEGVWWLILAMMAKDILIALILMGGIATMVLTIVRAIASPCAAEAALKGLRDHFRTGSSGALVPHEIAETVAYIMHNCKGR